MTASDDGCAGLLALPELLEPLIALPPDGRLPDGSSTDSEALARVAALSRLIAPSAALLVEEAAAAGQRQGFLHCTPDAAARSEPLIGAGQINVDGLSINGAADPRRVINVAQNEVSVGDHEAATTDA